MSRPPIPVLLVTGFLGSGKTTLVNHLLRNDLGLRLAVVVNDFGAVNIDQSLIVGQVGSAVSLSNGCLCCAVDSSGLDDMLGQLAAADLDGIVVEASGLAEPISLIRMIRASQRPQLQFGGAVHVIDGPRLLDLLDTHPETSTHPAIADLVVLNKIDLLDQGPPDQAIAARERLTQLADGTPVLETHDAAVDARLLFDLADRPQPDQPMLPFHDDRHEHHHLHAGYVAVEVSTEVPLDPRRLVALLSDPPAGCYRIKGHVRLSGDPSRRWTVQVVAGQIRFSPAERGGGSILVLIGPGLAPDAVRAAVTFCEDETDAGEGFRPIERFR